jgi:hypothetical protein
MHFSRSSRRKTTALPMSESSIVNNRYRPRAQSLFEHRPRVNTDFTIVLLEKFNSSRTGTSPSNATAISSDDCEISPRYKRKRAAFFICTPLASGLFIFPLLIIFWQAGWNFMWEFLNNTSTGKHWASLPLLYALAQSILLFIYLNQNNLYDYLYKHKDRWGTSIVLQMHSLVTSSTYIVQWISMWTIWDRYTSQDWLLMLIVSIAALLGVIALMGHPCDLVCAPFILSYDSIEYNIRIGSPFLTEKVSDVHSNVLSRSRVCSFR